MNEKTVFETAELKLLVDAVQSSQFITLAKSQSLIRKIASLTSVEEAKRLEQQVFVVNRVKTGNEEVFKNVDTLYEAISNERKIRFHYFQYNLDKEVQLRNNGEKYLVSPYALSWDNENYYLICNYPRHDGLTHFRVDKMLAIETLDMPCTPMDPDEGFNIVEYQQRIFSMFGGTEISVSFAFDNSLVNVVMDRFGKDVMLRKLDENYFQFTAKVAVSPVFYAWIFQFGDKARILAPTSIVEGYQKMICAVADQF